MFIKHLNIPNNLEKPTTENLVEKLNKVLEARQQAIVNTNPVEHNNLSGEEYMIFPKPGELMLPQNNEEKEEIIAIRDLIKGSNPTYEERIKIEDIRREQIAIEIAKEVEKQIDTAELNSNLQEANRLGKVFPHIIAFRTATRLFMELGYIDIETGELLS